MHCLYILSHFPQQKDALVIRFIHEEQMNKSIHWEIFNGASQNQKCGGGAIIYLSETSYLKIQMGLGNGTNNYVKVMNLKLLLCFSKEKGCTYLQLFGDSMIIVNWINKAQNYHIMFLLTLIEDVHYIVDNFDLCTCCHVHKEINSIVYKLSKEEDCRSLKWDIF